ncbi:EF-hand domain-containing protein [Polymorphobacter sp. PAMC 29334]|uniref:EF-hand domain-containing protein n=1 Tax=Polymorphobacter sp. PAMC 29334 TaxID=2862331 RepID=UPI001D028929|nr:EF-hand domain-containing protein [Polymorphobacter sp. PAMC 29334]
MIVPKWLAATVVAALMVCAVMLWRQSAPHAAAVHFSAPTAAEAAEITPAAAAAALVAPVSDVTPADREAKRFSRYDKDKDGAITRDEYFVSRKKAFAKLDINHDDKLSFEEYSVKAIAKFDAADTKHDGRLTPEEFATTAVKRRPRTKAVCPPGGAVTAAPEEPAEAQ